MINLQTTDWGSAFQKITTAAAAGLTPDSLTLRGIWVGPLASKNALLGIDEFVASWPERDQFYEPYLEDCKYEGTTYAIPIYSAAPTVVYRSDIFTEAGLDPATPPTTWDEYKEAAAALVQRDGDEVTREGADWGLSTSIGLQQSVCPGLLPGRRHVLLLSRDLPFSCRDLHSVIPLAQASLPQSPYLLGGASADRRRAERLSSHAHRP